MSYRIYSCGCLYEDYALSKDRNETFEQLESYLNQNKNGRLWVYLFKKENVSPCGYFACFHHVRRIIDNIVISSTYNETLSKECLNNTYFTNCLRKHFEENMTLYAFCRNCKVNLMRRSPDDFRLLRVKIYDRNEHLTTQQDLT